MTPTLDFLHEAEHRIRLLLEDLRPVLLEAQGNIAHRLKDDKSKVTEMDLLVEHRLQELLPSLDSGIGFGGEETGVDLEQKTFWLVDPIDGTEAFTRGLPFATNMIALIDQGQPVLGVIHNIALGDFYHAIKGQGAFKNGHKIHVSDRPLEHASLVWAPMVDRPGVVGLHDKLSAKGMAMRRFGGSGFDYAAVACGAVEGRIQFNAKGHEWDFAPGTLLVQEAGGRVANLGSTTYDYRDYNHIATNPVIFDELMKLLPQPS